MKLPEWEMDATAKKVDALADLAERLGRAITQVELDDVDLACIAGTSPETVGGWLSRQTTPQGNVRMRLLDLVAVLEKLAGVLRSQPAHDWLFAPNDSLDHHKPVDLLRTGEFRRVLGTIDAMSEGVFIT
jgi:hypothetical protein